MRWPMFVVRCLTLAFCCSACMTLVAEDICKTGWQKKPAKVPGARVVLKVSSTERGEALDWHPAHPESTYRPHGILELYTAKGPVDQEGNIAVCDSLYSFSSNVFWDKMPLSDLKQFAKVPGGYYAVQVTGVLSGPRESDTSDWVVVKIQ